MVTLAMEQPQWKAPITMVLPIRGIIQTTTTAKVWISMTGIES